MVKTSGVGARFNLSRFNHLTAPSIRAGSVRQAERAVHPAAPVRGRCEIGGAGGGAGAGVLSGWDKLGASQFLTVAERLLPVAVGFSPRIVARAISVAERRLHA